MDCTTHAHFSIEPHGRGVRIIRLVRSAGGKVDPYIVMSGGIGAGKTTAAEILGSEFEVPVFREQPDRNPFLRDFYADNRRWALASCMWFLFRSLRLQASAMKGGGVQDHSPAEGVHVFGRALEKQKDLEARELELLTFQLEDGQVGLRSPDLVIVLQAPLDELELRIQQRDRPYERGLSRRYLEVLEDFRAEFLGDWADSPILRVDTTQVDLRTFAGRRKLISLVRARLGD